MRYGTLCSGIEAPAAAWSPLGWEHRFSADVDPFCCALLGEKYPEVPNYGDVTRIDGRGLPAIDVLIFGSPCQSFSVAGRRAGLDDPRGVIAFECLRVAGELRPLWVVFENVPGLLSSNRGRDFGAILGALGQLGYGFAYRVLDAQHFGVPQRRRRVFVVGYLGDWRPAAAVLFERASLSGDSAPSREAGQAPAGCLGGGSGSRGWAPDTDRMTFVPGAFGEYDNGRPLLGAAGGDCGAGSEALVAATLKQRMRGYCDEVMDNLQVTHSLRADGFDASEDGTGRGTPLVTTFNLRGREGGAMPESDPDGLCNLRAASGGSSRTYVASMAVRRLLPTECEALQGFPRNYTAVTYRGKPAADGNRYRALGNSMAVPVIRWLGERIAMVNGL